MALYTMVMEEITPAAFFTIVLLMVVLYRTLCAMFVAMKNSSNTNAQPIHLEEVTDHQLTGSLLGSTERTTSSTAFQGASSSSSSLSIRPCRYDVFLSFKGEDTRHNFIAHLHQALLQKGINTFIDDEELESGEEIASSLIQAIEESKISIVVFSQAYASSKWCLDELLKILECKETNGQIVLPVFYKVDPSDVRHQKKNFEIAFAKHQERFKDDIKVQRWKSALTQVANLSGYHLENYENEAKFIDNIVQTVSRNVNRTCLHVAKHPVGIESRLKEIISLLSMRKNDTRMVGILGVGGIGKTTIAKSIYNSIASQFEGSCFLANVRENSRRESGFVKLQNALLSKLLGHTMVIDNVDEGITVIKKRLCSKKVLLVLDDVDQSVQLDNLAGEADWFGVGSIIIITTRDRKVLTNHGVVDDLIYNMKELNQNEALELFCRNAFKGEKPIDDFLKLTKDVISYCGRLPLALEVLGSYLHGRDMHQWKSALDKYKRIPHTNIQERLQISYDGLEENEKNIFLDIACFFKGESADYVLKILDACGFFPDVGIQVLIEKSLITIDEYNNLAMHDLLQDMGREVVRQESPSIPGKRSRLWLYEDVRAVLEKDMGTNNIQSIVIDLPGEDRVCLASNGFARMTSLKLLICKSSVYFSKQPTYLPEELRVIDWNGYPLEYLPSNFRGRNMRILRMPRSNIKELKQIQSCKCISIMDFSNSKSLKIFPDVSSLIMLEKLTLDGCIDLVEIHHSVGFLDKLEHLSIERCYNLSSFPRSLMLRSLKYLSLLYCPKLNDFPEINCQMKFLEYINFGHTGIKELPSSIRNVSGLKDLVLEGCINLMNLPSSIYQLQHLKHLNLKGCSRLVKFPKKLWDNQQYMPPPMNPSVSNHGCSSIVFPALQVLNLRDCVLFEFSNFFRIFNFSSTLEVLDISGTAIVTIPACIKRFVCLRQLWLCNCKQLREILERPPNIEYVYAEGCISLETFLEEPQRSQLFTTWCLPEIVATPQPSREHPKRRHFNCLLSGNKVPDWLNYHKEASNSNSCEIVIDEPADLNGEITTIAFSAVVVGIEHVQDYGILSISAYVISDGVEIYSGNGAFQVSGSNYVWLHFHVPESFKLKAYNGHLQVKFVCFSDSKSKVFKSCGFHLIRRIEGDISNRWYSIRKRSRDDDDDGADLESNWYWTRG
ncbi:disease resistance protein RUN1-like isoform X2 [Corylus avellana]|uniref:disease resistance protein RUN1-like isoform X2 n=1 Tax=Corylus avellana TaxID=13451 RepID=UPI00286B9E62|nr:disease resistance protein RUN1-like isoform X2 [Corylus avellana]